MDKIKIKELRVQLCKQLHEFATKKGITHEVISEKTGLQRSNVTRMLTGKYTPTLDNFLLLLEALDIFINFEAKNNG